MLLMELHRCRWFHFNCRIVTSNGVLSFYSFECINMLNDVEKKHNAISLADVTMVNVTFLNKKR